MDGWMACIDEEKHVDWWEWQIDADWMGGKGQRTKCNGITSTGADNRAVSRYLWRWLVFQLCTMRGIYTSRQLKKKGVRHKERL